MRDYTKISTTIWNSRKFTALSDSGKLLYFYYLSCTFVNSVGCFVVKSVYVMGDLGWKEATYEKSLSELIEANLVKRNKNENLIFIMNFLNIDPFQNPKHATGSIKVALKLPDCREKLDLLKIIKNMKYVQKASNYDDFDRVLKALSKGYRNTETETEPDTDTDTDLSADADRGADAAPPDKKKRKTDWQEGWRPEPLSKKMNDKLQLSQDELKHEFGKFKESCKAHDRKYVDWNAAWRNWLQSDYGTYGQRIKGGGGQENGRSSAGGNRPQAAGLGGSFERELEAQTSQSAVESYINVTPEPKDTDGTLNLSYDADT